MLAASLHRAGQAAARPAGRGGPGLIERWLDGMGEREERRVFLRLVRCDAALERALPESFGRSPRVARFGLMLLAECAREMGLSPGELAALMDDAESELLHAMVRLTGARGHE